MACHAIGYCTPGLVPVGLTQRGQLAIEQRANMETAATIRSEYWAPEHVKESLRGSG